MKIYTRSGDNGQTLLYGGIRISKAHMRTQALGAVDELNSYIGLLADYAINQPRADMLREIQDKLFVMGTYLASAPEKENLLKPVFDESDVVRLEKEIDTLQDTLSELRCFILPGGHQQVTFCHIARTVCRRAERAVVALHEYEPVNEIILKYLNRLSDYLFVLARTMAKDLKVKEIYWQPKF